MDNLIQFRMSICDLINKTELPFSAKYFVLKDVMTEVEKVYEQYATTCISTNVSKEQEEKVTFEVPVEEKGREQDG